MLTDPPPGSASDADWQRQTETGQVMELVDGTLVEKAKSYEASVIAMTIGAILHAFVTERHLGVVSGADGADAAADRESTRGHCETSRASVNASFQPPTGFNRRVRLRFARCLLCHPVCLRAAIRMTDR